MNDKSSDDDDLESRTGVKNKSELLQQLLKPEKDTEDERKTDGQSHRDDTLLRSLGFPPSPSNERARKRPSEDRDDGPNCKRESSQVRYTFTNHTILLQTIETYINVFLLLWYY